MARAEYEAVQRARSEAKWTLNGITREEVAWIQAHVSVQAAAGPILCLGVRNGLEVDLFREAFYGPEAGRGGSRTPPNNVQGVELHPQGTRADVWVGSFDAMPAAWAGRFALLYSNAFDHAYDPEATAREWRRVAQRRATIALTLPIGNEPTPTDPIADVTLGDVSALFQITHIVVHHYEAPGSPWRIIAQLP